MNLFEINEDIIQALESAIDMETGEIINEEAYANLDKLQMEFDQKVENTVLYIKNLQADVKALKEEKDAFAQRQKQAEKRIENLKDYLTKALNGEKFESTKCKVSFRSSEAVNITDFTKLDDDYLTYKEPDADKTKIKKALKEGIKIEGAELVTKQNIQIK